MIIQIYRRIYDPFIKRERIVPCFRIREGDCRMKRLLNALLTWIAARIFNVPKRRRDGK